MRSGSAIVSATKPPVSRVPIRSPDGKRASHALEAQGEPVSSVADGAKT